MNGYGWQSECVEKWFCNQGHGIVQAVTGAGKTKMALMLMEELKQSQKQKLYVRIVVPTTALMKQWERELRYTIEEKSGTVQKVGRFGNGYKDSPDQEYMVYTIHSARYHLARHIMNDLTAGKAVLLIADECHHYVSGENKKIFEFLPYIEQLPGKYYSLGLSATPDVTGCADVLIPALGKIIYRYRMQQAMKNHTLCPCVLYNIALPFSIEEKQQYQELSDAMLVLRNRLLKFFPKEMINSGSAFFALLRNEAQKETPAGIQARKYLLLALKRKKLVCQAQSRISCAENLVKDIYRGNYRKNNRCLRVLVFGERIEQIEKLYQLLNHTYPGKVGRYHSKMGKMANENTLQRFRNGELYIVLSCRAMDEGVDLPDADAAIILSGTSVQRQHIQRMGRVLRKSTGKKIAAVYYMFIKESVEEHVYYFEHDKYYMAELEYDAKQNSIRYDAYENAADRVVTEFLPAGVDERVYVEVMQCLQDGELLPDWFLKQSDFQELIDSSKSRLERNYWYCMRKISIIRNGREETSHI